MKQFSVLFAVSLSLFISGVSLPAGAQGETGEAKQKFVNGREYFDTGRYAEAAQAFRDAYQLSPNWKILFNIAQSEAASKNYGIALQYFEEYLAMGGDDIPMGRRDEVVEEVRRLRDMVGFIDVVAPAGCTVTVGNVNRGVTPLSGPVVVTAGVEHTVVIRLGERILFEQLVRVSSQTTRTLTLSDDTQSPVEPSDTSETNQPKNLPVKGPALADAASPKIAKDASTAEAKRPTRLQMAGWITLGCGFGALIAGGVVGAVTLSKANGLDETYPNGVPSNKAGELDTIDRLATTTDVLLISGGTLAVTGIVFLLVNKKKNRPITVLPTVNRTLAGVLWTGEF